MFATTTVIDFAPVFRDPRLAEAAVRSLLRWSQASKTLLHAYVVMHHHIHIVARLPAAVSGAAWMQRFKTDSALLVRPKLSAVHIAHMSQQIGLNDRRFWKRSFRSTVLVTPRVFWQKVRYTHLNPVRAGYCEREEDYVWSSKRHWEAGLWSDESGLDLARILREMSGEG